MSAVTNSPTEEPVSELSQKQRTQMNTYGIPIDGVAVPVAVVGAVVAVATVPATVPDTVTAQDDPTQSHLSLRQREQVSSYWRG